MLYIFDVDGTLISSYMDAPNRNYDDWQVLPGRLERLQQLLQDGQQIAFATNQAGVAFGHVTEQQVMDKLHQVRDQLQFPADTRIKACYAHARARSYKYRAPEQVARRKPSGAMLRELAAELPAAAADGVVYVGDRPEDKAAAEDAGATFIWVNEFFGTY